MFRCRSPAECERLYGLINWARMNNPTYIALERARPKIQPKVTFANDPQPRTQSASGASWYKFGGSSKRSSYRASSGQGPKALSAGGVSGCQCHEYGQFVLEEVQRKLALQPQQKCYDSKRTEPKRGLIIVFFQQPRAWHQAPAAQHQVNTGTFPAKTVLMSPQPVLKLPMEEAW